MVAPHVRIGCSGWSYQHWKDDFYPSDLPQARRLAQRIGLLDEGGEATDGP